MTANSETNAPVQPVAGAMPIRPDGETEPLNPLGDEPQFSDAPVATIDLGNWECDDEIDSARWLVTLSHPRLRGDGPHLAHRSTRLGIRPPAEFPSHAADEEIDGARDESRDWVELRAHETRNRSSKIDSSNEEDSASLEAASAARSWSAIGWAVTTLGLSAVACGSILAGWSLFGSRGELWHVGLPVALAGQVAAVIGLMLLVDTLGPRQRGARPQDATSHDDPIRRR